MDWIAFGDCRIDTSSKENKVHVYRQFEYQDWEVSNI